MEIERFMTVLSLPRLFLDEMSSNRAEIRGCIGAKVRMRHLINAEGENACLRTISRITSELHENAKAFFLPPTLVGYIVICLC